MQGAILIFAALAIACTGEPILQAQRLGSIYKGPNSETIISGPDGSVITAASAGGIVDTNGQLGPAGPLLLTGEPDAELLPVAVSPATTLIQHEPIFVSSSPSPILHEVSRTLLSNGEHLIVDTEHGKTATAVASNGLGSSATASISTSGGVVTAEASVSSHGEAVVAAHPVVKEVVSVIGPITAPPVGAVAVAPVREVIALEEPAPIIPIPELPTVEVRAADTALIGPSGTISTKGGSATINGPASLTISNNGVVSEAIKVDTVPLIPAPVAPVHTIVTGIVEPAKETIVVSTPAPSVLVQDVEAARIDLGPQKFIQEAVLQVPHHREPVIVSAVPAPIFESRHEISHNVAAAVEEERYVAQSLTPPRVAHQEVLLRTVQGPPAHLIHPTQQRVTSENVRREQILTAAVPQYVDESHNANFYQRSSVPNIPLHPPHNSVPAAILDRQTAYSANIVGRNPHL